MTAHVKIGGSWRNVKEMHVKVGGSWRKIKEGYVKINGVWKSTYKGVIPIPAGLIVALNSTSIPSGWTRYAAADGKFIVGAGGSYAVGATGGSWSAGTLTTSSGGAHAGSAHAKNVYFTGDTTGYVNEYSGGSHTHTVAVNPYYPNRQATILIKADAETDAFPANAVVLADGALSGPTANYGTNGDYLLGYSSIGHYGSNIVAGTPSSAGSHNHGATGSGGTGSAKSSGAVYQNSGAHTNHSVPLQVAAESIKKVLLRALTSAAAFELEPGIIGLWDGATIPAGWTEMTSFRDYYIQINSAGAGTVSGNNTIRFTATLGNGGVSHIHNNGTSNGNNPVTAWSGAYTNTHSHTIDQTVSFLAPYLALKIIKYTG